MPILLLLLGEAVVGEKNLDKVVVASNRVQGTSLCLVQVVAVVLVVVDKKEIGILFVGNQKRIMSLFMDKQQRWSSIDR